jgi:hypothetical protein
MLAAPHLDAAGALLSLASARNHHRSDRTPRDVLDLLEGKRPTGRLTNRESPQWELPHARDQMRPLRVHLKLVLFSASLSSSPFVARGGTRSARV